MPARPHRRRWIAGAFLLLLASQVRGSAQLPLSDNTAAPYSGVYRWGVSGCNHGHYDAFAAWVNRPAIWPEDFMPADSWDNIEGQGWILSPWSKWVKLHEGRRLILSVPLLVGPMSGKGPAKGIAAGIPVSLEQGAKGDYNEHFRKLATNLVARGLGDTILRLGWEFNGGWYVWHSKKKEEAFAEYWRQIVKTMRAVPGAEKLHFCWNPAINIQETGDARKCYPGDEFVDSIGLDVYDQSWLTDTYPWKKDASAEEIQAAQDRAWKGWTWGRPQAGLELWKDFAQEHHKPIAIPEWGVCWRKDGHGGGDNPAFIERMHRFITDPANNVIFHCYFDVQAGDGHHQLSPDDKGAETTEFPKASARFKELFRNSAPAAGK